MGTVLSRRRKALFALVMLAAFLLCAEIGTRLYRAPLHFGSFRVLRVDRERRGTPSVLDPRLGYAPRPGYSGSTDSRGTRVTIDAGGLRSNGGPAPAGDPAVGAVGDSFTFGDQVGDDETWPARLERILGRRVVNGGVFGYSLTQSVLRAEDLLARFDPAWLVVSYIPRDLDRCEFAKKWAPVPWFDIRNGELVLRNCPVTDPCDPAEIRSRGIKNLLGYSALLDAILANAAREWWYLDQRQVRVHPPGTGTKLGLLLVDRALDLCRREGCGLLVLLQGREATPGATAVLDHARSAGAVALDLIGAVDRLATRDPTVPGRYFDGHMTAEGNLWAARKIAEILAAHPR